MTASTFCLLFRDSWLLQPVVAEHFTPSPCPLPEGEGNEGECCAGGLG